MAVEGRQLPPGTEQQLLVLPAHRLVKGRTEEGEAVHVAHPVGDGQGGEAALQGLNPIEGLEGGALLNAGGEAGQMPSGGISREQNPGQVETVLPPVLLQPAEAGKHVLYLPPEVHLGQQAVAHPHHGVPLGGQGHAVVPVQLPVPVHPAAPVDIHHRGQRALGPLRAVQVQGVHGVPVRQIGQSGLRRHPLRAGLAGQAEGVLPAVLPPLLLNQHPGQISHSKLLLSALPKRKKQPRLSAGAVFLPVELSPQR